MNTGTRVINKNGKHWLKGTVIGNRMDHKVGRVRVEVRWDWPVRGFVNPVCVSFIDAKTLFVVA